MNCSNIFHAPLRRLHQVSALFLDWSTWQYIYALSKHRVSVTFLDRQPREWEKTLEAILGAGRTYIIQISFDIEGDCPRLIWVDYSRELSEELMLHHGLLARVRNPQLAHHQRTGPSSKVVWRAHTQQSNGSRNGLPFAHKTS
jgi:hypothetical protein